MIADFPVIRGASDVSADAICDINIAAATTTQVPQRPVCINDLPNIRQRMAIGVFHSSFLLDKE
jgi:hypothetical protein